ncbi:MAG: hypothetical protein U0795_00425 [Pirellulales bacterium]
MQLTTLVRLTIVTESVLRERLTREIMQSGATGYTVWPAEGEGSRHFRSGDSPGDNICLETIVSSDVAQRMLAHLAAEYFPHYAMIAYGTDVHVVRGDKYV